MNSRQLSILPENKTSVFYSPIEGPSVLVRTGTPSDNSFIHAILQASPKQNTSVDQFIKNIYLKLWNNLKLSDTSVNDIFKNNIKDFYKHIITQKNFISLNELILNTPKKTIETYKIICEIITLEHFEKDIIPKSYKQHCDDTINSYKKDIIRRTSLLCNKLFDDLGSSIETQRKKYCIDKIESLISELFNQANDIAYNKYIQKTPINTDIINTISNDLNRNIYFLNSTSRIPYKTENTIKKRKSIILLSFDSNHYETVGNLLPENKIQREFYFDEPLIDCIHKFTYQPELIEKEYPTLTKYLQNKNSSSRSSSRSSSSCSGSSRYSSRSRTTSSSSSDS